MGIKKTKILITERNSVWGIIQHQVAENEYPHILSWETEELKDEFINVELFPKARKENPNFNFKDYMREESYPTKPMTILSDIKAEFKFDYKDTDLIIANSENIKFEKQQILNKDFAIILEIDENGKETWTYWAISITQTSTPQIFQANCELDIFFTYNIKDMINENDIMVKRAMAKRFNEKGIPNIFNNINTFPEEFDANFNNIQYLDKVLKEHNEHHSYIMIPTEPFDIKLWFEDQGANRVADWKFNKKKDNDDIIEFKDARDLYFPFIIISTDDDFSLKALIFSEQAYNGEFIIPINLSPHSYINTIHNDTNKQLNKFYNYGREDYTINNIFSDIKISEDFNDITKPFNWKYEGKIYKSPYYVIRIDDYNNQRYEIPFNYLSEEIKYYINVLLTQNMMSSSIRVSNDLLDNKNSLYGIESQYNPISQKSVSPKDTYDAYHKASFENQIKNAERHQLQKKVSGSLGIIGGIVSGVESGIKLSPSGVVGGVEKIAQGGIEIANAKEELNGLLAMQQDLENSPSQISNGNLEYYYLYNYRNYDAKSNKVFYSIKRLKPIDIILEKLAWYFHIAGVNYASTPHNLNELINMNYYYNYIQTGQSVFSSFALDLSAPIKQLVDTTLKQGTTIWHIRDLKTFKGIANYNVNNVEMELLKNE